MILSLQGVQPPGINRNPMAMLDASNHEALSQLAGMAGKSGLGSIANDISTFVDNQSRKVAEQVASAAPVASFSPRM